MERVFSGPVGGLTRLSLDLVACDTNSRKRKGSSSPESPESPETPEPPKKVRRLLRALENEEIGPFQDLTCREEAMVEDAANQLRSPRRAASLLRVVGGPASSTEEPARYKKYSQTPWMSRLAERLTLISGVAQRAPDAASPPLATEHIFNFTGVGGHFIPPDDPLLHQLGEPYVNLLTGVYTASLFEKFSSFFPCIGDQTDVIKMSRVLNSVFLLKGMQIALVKVVHPITKVEIFCIKCLGSFVITTFYPLFHFQAYAPGVSCKLEILNQLTQVRQTFEVGSKSLLEFARQEVQAKKDPVLADPDKKEICIDCTPLFHQLGLSLHVQKGIVLSFRAEEVGYKFAKTLAECSKAFDGLGIFSDSDDEDDEDEPVRMRNQSVSENDENEEDQWITFQ